MTGIGRDSVLILLLDRDLLYLFVIGALDPFHGVLLTINSLFILFLFSLHVYSVCGLPCRNPGNTIWGCRTLPHPASHVGLGRV
jgi:hypothetical protein